MYDYGWSNYTYFLPVSPDRTPFKAKFDTALYAKSASIIVVALLFLRILLAPDPEQRLKRILKDADHLDANEIVEKRKRP